jgi:hypothetical protein
MNMRGFGGAAPAASHGRGMRGDRSPEGGEAFDYGDPMEAFRYGFEAPHYLKGD